MIAVLCADTKSTYFDIECPALDIYTIKRPVELYKGGLPVIAHPPCAQWSKLRSFSKENQKEKDLAKICIDHVHEIGGILEHPSGSIMFDFYGLDRNKIRSVNQSWFGFRARKTTYLYCHNVQLDPIQSFGNVPDKTVDQIQSRMRSRQTVEFSKFLVNSVSRSLPG